MQAADISIDDTVYAADFWTRLRNNIVVGYEDPDGSIHQNRKFLDGATIGFIAGNIAHESMHKIGYEHDFDATAIRPYSVPYGIGDIVTRLLSEQGNAVLDHNTATPVVAATPEVNQKVEDDAPTSDDSGTECTTNDESGDDEDGGDNQS